MRNKRILWITSAVAACAIIAVMVWWNRPVAVPTELPRASLELKDGRMVTRKEGVPFTGIMFEQTTKGQRLTEVPLKDGIIQGLVRGWYDSGQLEVEEHFENGISQGMRKRWHENGKLRNEVMIVDGKLEGSYKEWYDNGVQAVVMTMVKGQGQGLCEAWHPDGNLKSRITLEKGDPVKKEYFPSKAEEVVGK